MSKPVVTIEQTSSVKGAMQIMNSKNIRRLVVVDKDKMVGIITLKDIFKLINRSPELITEFYGPTFPVKFSEIYEKFTEYKFDNPPGPGL
jgi:predicted transcriptional regulator